MRNSIFVPIFMVAIAAAVAACGDSKNNTVYDAPVQQNIDAPVVFDAGPPDASCFTNPTTHNEIINACTDAQFADKNPTLPLTLSDGGLPPLP